MHIFAVQESFHLITASCACLFRSKASRSWSCLALIAPSCVPTRVAHSTATLLGTTSRGREQYSSQSKRIHRESQHADRSNNVGKRASNAGRGGCHGALLQMGPLRILGEGGGGSSGMQLQCTFLFKPLGWTLKVTVDL
jgi:hypothetical protein